MPDRYRRRQKRQPPIPAQTVVGQAGFQTPGGPQPAQAMGAMPGMPQDQPATPANPYQAGYDARRQLAAMTGGPLVTTGVPTPMTKAQQYQYNLYRLQQRKAGAEAEPFAAWRAGQTGTMGVNVGLSLATPGGVAETRRRLDIERLHEQIRAITGDEGLSPGQKAMAIAEVYAHAGMPEQAAEFKGVFRQTLGETHKGDLRKAEQARELAGEKTLKEMELRDKEAARELQMAEQQEDRRQFDENLQLARDRHDHAVRAGADKTTTARITRQLTAVETRYKAILARQDKITSELSAVARDWRTDEKATTRLEAENAKLAAEAHKLASRLDDLTEELGSLVPDTMDLPDVGDEEIDSFLDQAGGDIEEATRLARGAKERKWAKERK